jgi:hypothetical protein
MGVSKGVYRNMVIAKMDDLRESICERHSSHYTDDDGDMQTIKESLGMYMEDDGYGYSYLTWDGVDAPLKDRPIFDTHFRVEYSISRWLGEELFTWPTHTGA